MSIEEKKGGPHIAERVGNMVIDGVKAGVVGAVGGAALGAVVGAIAEHSGVTPAVGELVNRVSEQAEQVSAAAYTLDNATPATIEAAEAAQTLLKGARAVHGGLTTRGATEALAALGGATGFAGGAVNGLLTAPRKTEGMSWAQYEQERAQIAAAHVTPTP